MYSSLRTPVNDVTLLGCKLPQIFSNRGARKVNPFLTSSFSTSQFGFGIKFAFGIDKVICFPEAGFINHKHVLTPFGRIMLPDSDVSVVPQGVAM